MRFRTKNARKIHCQDVATFIVLFTTCFRWLLDGVITNYVFSLALFIVGVLMLYVGRSRLDYQAFVLFCFPVAIFLSFLINGTTLSALHQSVLVILVVVFALSKRQSLTEFRSGVDFISCVGVLTALSILVQLVFGESYNSVYFSLLKQSALEVAQYYWERGYYFGFNYRPHIAAGLISFAIVAILLKLSLKVKKKSRKQYRTCLLLVVLALALFLTQKKGVLAVLILALGVTFMLVFATKKHWAKVVRVLCVAAVAVVVLAVFIQLNPDNVVFRRITEFMSDLLSGESVDNGRFRLYRNAAALFVQNFFFGIGWRAFSALTVSNFGFYFEHQVNCDYLQFLCETGIVGFLLFMVPIVTMMYRAIRLCRYSTRLELDPDSRYMIIFATFVQIFTVCYAIMEDPFYDIMYFSVYCISCAMINCGWRTVAAATKALRTPLKTVV